MSTTTTSTTRSDSDIIREFLALPAIHWDMPIRLRADADGWREGVIARV